MRSSYTNQFVDEVKTVCFSFAAIEGNINTHFEPGRESVCINAV